MNKSKENVLEGKLEEAPEGELEGEPEEKQRYTIPESDTCNTSASHIIFAFQPPLEVTG